MSDKSIVYEKPSDVRAVDGSVEVTGPDAVTFTAHAAEEHRSDYSRKVSEHVASVA